MTPTMIRSPREGDVHEGPPFGSHRLLEQIHSGLVGEFVSLARVAGDAGADDIFPSGLPPSVARQHMVDVEMAAVENSGAVLAGILVSLEYIMPCELDFLFRQAVKEAEDDDPRNADSQGNSLEHPGLGIGDGEILPTQEIMGKEIA